MRSTEHHSDRDPGRAPPRPRPRRRGHTDLAVSGPPLGLLARLPTNGRHLYPEAIGSANGPVTSSETSVSCPPDRPTGCELDRFPGEVRIMVSSLRLLLLAHYSQDR
ncbi:hypothetical protein Franean1_0794 [Parafrankia sp. EAN1pec]|nr:hypothetical protein Franean1_0794 [Frankia sp. EAN1pec]